MSKSQLVRARDVARLLHLGRELDELPPDPAARMQHVAQSVCRLLRAKLGAMGFGEGFTPAERPRFTSAVGAGSIDQQEQAVFVRYVAGDISVDPCIPELASHCQSAYAFRREQLVNNKQWYGYPHVSDDRRAAGVDDVIYSMRRLNRRGTLQSIAVHRPWGDPRRFNEQDRTLLRLAHLTVAPKIAPPRPLTRPQRLARQLSLRLRQTLARLLLGESEKQIAVDFSLSRHTVHGYVKSIYAHFQVAGRAELMSHWVELGDELR
ncbi:MAG: Transcriptional regulator, LuxR family protein [Phycisphaerales bacterium]|nr:Transcriptional regulator, LuxR family protein [Phycisphaerales bacterium]